MHFRQSFACGAQVSPAARHFAPFSHALARGRLARRGGWRRRDGQLRWRCARLYLCPGGCSGRCRGRWDRPQRLRRKRRGRNCQFIHGLTVMQKGKSAQIAHAVGGSSTGLQHCRGLLLQAQGGETRRWYRPGRRQQLDRPVSGSRVGPDMDQSSSARLARMGKGPAAGRGSC